MLFVDVKTNDIQYTPTNLIDLEVAASVTKTVDKTTVKTLDVFTYTINASFSGLTGSIVGAQIKDFIPSYLNYFLPPIQAPLVNIIETPVAGGTELTFDFGTITDTGISIVITLGASFKQGTPNGQTFVNELNQYVNGSIVNTTTAPPVTLNLVPNWAINKYIASPYTGQATPGSTVTYNLILTNTGDPGAVANNIVVTDTLPSGLTPDLSFTPTGIDVSNTDPNVLGLTGSWSGNTMIFNIPSYYGTNYKISYKAIVDPNATIGQTITNTGNLAINGSSYPSSSSTLTIANAIISGAISKYGAEHAYPGAYVTYPIYFTNTGNQDLTNAVLIDTIPPEIIVKQVVPGKVCSPSDCPTMNITISYELNNNGTYILLGSYPNEAYQRIDLPTITPPAKVTSIKWEFPFVPVSGGSSVAEGERITGIIDPATPPTTTSTTNVVTLTADGLGPVTASITTLLDGKNTPSVLKENSPTTNVVPGQIIKYTLSAFNYWGPYTEPIYADLLPPEVDYANNVLYRMYYSPTNQTIYSTDPNFTNFLVPLTPEVIPNYMGTGRTLVRFKFAPGSVITQESYVQIDFDVKVKVGATGTIVNNGVFGDPGNNMISTHGQLTQVDTLDLDGDGNTTELLLLSNDVTNGINFSTSLASDKKVKGSLDTAFTEWPNVGLTTAGGTIDYKLTVTNTGNVNLESFEIIDILPHLGDTGVILNTTPRGSQFTVYQISAVNATLSPIYPGDPTPILNLDYSTSYDPVRFSETDTTGNSIGTGTWQTTVPVPITSTAAFKITSVNTKLKPGQSIVINIVCIAPLGAPTDLVAWNSFALRGSYLDQNGNLAYLLPVEPQQVGVQIKPQAPTVAALGDYVWYDTNGDGIQDPGEPGINGIVVNLYDSTGTNLIATTLTAPDFSGNDGFYQFGNLQPGCYFVEFIKPNNTFVFSPKGQGTDPTKDSNVNPATGFTDQICLVAGEYNNTIDAGLSQNAQAFIGNLVWNDLNHNGIQDSGEPGVGNVTVNLLDSNGNVIKTTTTDPSGNYFFAVTPGCYFVEFVKPAGYIFTIQNAGTDDTIDSDADPVTGITPQVCVVASEVNNSIDAGIYVPAKAHIGDFVWNDLNGNGIQDPGEPGISGVPVNLLDNTTGAVLQTTTTDANGKYLFNVTPGCYKVAFIKPAGYNFTLQNVGTDPAINSNADPVTGITPQVCVTSGQSDLTIDAGLYQMASIGDFVWNDLNHNGIQDAGEPGISGVTVNLLDNTTGAVLQTTTTDTSGKYLFNVAPGCYKVAFIKPTGYNFTLQNVGTDPAINSNADPVTGITPQVCVTSGQSDLTIDAGLYQMASIGDFVWNDLNGNGLQDSGEPGISGVTVNLLDNTTGAVLQTTTTDANGKYLFNVTPGCYKVAFIKPAGYNFTLQNVGTDPAINSNADPVTGITPQVCVTSGQNDLTIDAGLTQPASIGDFVWNDLNGNGLQDPGEPGISGVTVNLLDNSTGTVLQTTTTDTNGKYLFNVNPGCYKVAFVKPTDYVFTLQNVGSNPSINSNPNPITGITPQVCVTSGQSDLTIDAGLYKPALLGDYVWDDLNMNGIQDPGEPGFYNATVNLLNSSGQIIATTKTDANGKYLFAVAPGCYSIQVIRPSGYMFTIQNAGTDPTKLSAVNSTTGITAQVCLKSGEQNLNLDAGIYLIPCDFRQAVNDLIESVALEETGLAHIINAEGEKIQAAMALKFSEADLLNINSSVTETLKIISKLEILLQYKLEITDGICPK